MQRAKAKAKSKGLNPSRAEMQRRNAQSQRDKRMAAPKAQTRTPTISTFNTASVGCLENQGTTTMTNLFGPPVKGNIAKTFDVVVSSDKDGIQTTKVGGKVVSSKPYFDVILDGRVLKTGNVVADGNQPNLMTVRFGPIRSSDTMMSNIYYGEGKDTVKCICKHPNIAPCIGTGQNLYGRPVFRIDSFTVKMSDPTISMLSVNRKKSTKIYDFQTLPTMSRGTAIVKPPATFVGEFVHALNKATAAVRVYTPDLVAANTSRSFSVEVAIGVTYRFAEPVIERTASFTTYGDKTIITTTSDLLEEIEGTTTEPPAPSYDEDDLYPSSQPVCDALLKPKRDCGSKPSVDNLVTESSNKYAVGRTVERDNGFGTMVIYHYVNPVSDVTIQEGVCTVNGNRAHLKIEMLKGHAVALVQARNIQEGEIIQITEYIPVFYDLRYPKLAMLLGYTQPLLMGVLAAAYCKRVGYPLVKAIAKQANTLCPRATRIVKELRDDPDSILGDEDVHGSISIEMKNANCLESELLLNNNNAPSQTYGQTSNMELGQYESENGLENGLRARGQFAKNTYTKSYRKANADRMAKTESRRQGNFDQVKRENPEEADREVEREPGAEDTVANTAEETTEEVAEGALEWLTKSVAVVFPPLMYAAAAGVAGYMIFELLEGNLSLEGMVPKDMKYKTKVHTLHERKDGAMLLNGKPITIEEIHAANYLLGRGPPTDAFARMVLKQAKTHDYEVVLPRTYVPGCQCKVVQDSIVDHFPIEVKVINMRADGKPRVHHRDGTCTSSIYCDDIFGSTNATYVSDCLDHTPNADEIRSGLFGAVLLTHDKPIGLGYNVANQTAYGVIDKMSKSGAMIDSIPYECMSDVTQLVIDKISANHYICIEDVDPQTNFDWSVDGVTEKMPFVTMYLFYSRHVAQLNTAFVKYFVSAKSGAMYSVSRTMRSASPSR